MSEIDSVIYFFNAIIEQKVLLGSKTIERPFFRVDVTVIALTFNCSSEFDTLLVNVSFSFEFFYCLKHKNISAL